MPVEGICIPDQSCLKVTGQSFVWYEEQGGTDL